MAGFFFTGEETAALSPETVARRRKLLDALQQDAISTAPVQHWSQGAARIVNALANNFEEGRLNEAEKAGNARVAQFLAGQLGASVSPTPPPAAAGGSASPPAAAPNVSRETGLDAGPAGLIRKFEGYRDKPYWDVNAHRVGYGSDTITNPDGSVQRVQPGMQITRDQAELDLQRRINSEFMPRAQQAVGDNWSKLSPGAQAALTSVTYNYGSLPQSVAAAARTGDPAQIAAAVEGLSGHNGGVNANRRMQEAAIIRGGAAPSESASPAASVRPTGVPSPSPALAAALADPWLSRNPIIQQMLAAQLGRNPVDDALKRVQLAQAQRDLTDSKPFTIKIDGEEVSVTRDAQGNLRRVQLAGETGPAQPKTYRTADGRDVQLPSDPAARKKFLEEMGQAGAKAVQGAPDAVQTAQISLNVIDQLIGNGKDKKEHPGLQNLFGLRGKLPSYPGGAAADADALLAQIKDRSFLQGIEAMRGTGAITEAEGAKATGAIARLSTNQSPKAFRDSLNELRGILQTAMQRNQTIASGGRAPAAQNPMPKPGAIQQDGWKIEQVN